MEVMKVQCPTCPFREQADGRVLDPDLKARVERQVLSEASQICHHPSLKGKPETHLCRGARDLQLRLFHSIGFIEAPTDEAWNKKRKELGV